MSDTAIWPVDFDALNIGSRIPAEDIERAYGVQRTDPRYRLKAMALVEQIRRQRTDLDPYVRCCGLDIIVMDDAEASRHHQGRFKTTARQLMSAHQRTMCVDTAKLEDSDRAEHERAVYVNGRIVSAIGNTRKQLRLEAKARTLPIPD